MGIEEQYLDVLQNIEFAIVGTYREHPEMTDYEVIRTLEAVVDAYKAETTGHAPRDLFLSDIEVACYEAVRSMCQWRLGRSADEAQAGPAPEPISVDEIILCLKRILKSVNKWNKSSGRKGYLNFIVQYVK